MSQGDLFNRFILTYGLVPARYSIHEYSLYFSSFQQVFSFVSYMFLHGSFWHLLGNMWFLYIFGDNVEDRLGHLKYLLFYVLCGITSGLTHLFFNVTSTLPTVGASGAIAGVMGAYFLLYPAAKIVTLIPIVIIPYFFEIPAALFLGIWLFLQFISAAFTGADVGGIAWWAHIGGFLFGALFLKLFLMLPKENLPGALGEATVRKSTPRLHVAHPVVSSEDPDIYGTLAITPEEAERGSSKLVSIPVGYQKKLVRLRIPPGIKDGAKIRLAGLGRKDGEGKAGDVYLIVSVRDIYNL
jgi:hypothetical protein